ncbi:MAG: PilZ domain-containing protein [Ruminococcaceae bacterium]|nr:PilZ domain-containing protein [Oscillospiraceae bacterium]
MLALPQEYLGSLCEIKSLENELLAVGRIIKIDKEALELAGRDDERMPLLQYRAPVKVFAHHAKLDTRILVGTIYLSTENFVRVEGVRSLQNFERRGAFRVNSAVPGKLTLYLTAEEQADFDRRLVKASDEAAQGMVDNANLDVQVMDISLTGVRLRSSVPLVPGTRYMLDFAPLEQHLTFLLRVQRLVTMPNGETQYGCIFFDYTEKQLDTLCRDLFQLQRMEKSRRRNAAAAQ